jgi:hypothetical protein
MSTFNRVSAQRLLACTTLFITSLLAGCGNLPQDPPPTRPGDNVSGRINLEGVDFGSVRARVGTTPPTSVSNMTFSGQLRLNAPGLILVENRQSQPLLMAFRPERAGAPSTVEDIEVSPFSTAVALVYMTPLIAQDSAEDQDAMVSLISDLSETTVLAEAIEDSLRSNSTSDPTSDHRVQRALEQAVDAAIGEVLRRAARGGLVR